MLKFSCEKAESKYNCLINKQTDYLLGIVIILLVVFIAFMRYVSYKLDNIYTTIKPKEKPKPKKTKGKWYV